MSHARQGEELVDGDERQPMPAWVALIAAAVAAIVIGGCTALVLDDAEQCDTTADCAFLGPQHYCNEEHVCSALGGCTVDADCEAKGLMGHTCDANHTCQPACTTSQECLDASGGTPAACIEERCVVLTSQDCKTVVPSDMVGNDNTIFIGFMGPLIGDYQSLGIPIQQATQLALEEIEERANGLPGTNGGPRRPLVLINCHDLDDPTRAAKHLAETVKVPAIVGPAFSGVTLDVATSVTIPAGTLVISASATSPALTDLQDDGLVWRTAPSDALQAIPLAELVLQLEQRIRTEQSMQPADAIRVATASKGDAYGQGLFDSLSPILIFNDKTAAQNLSDNNFLPKQYDDPSIMAVDFEPTVADILAFVPQLVLPLGTNEGITEIMVGIEQGWPTGANPPPRPLYLFPDGGRLDELLAATQTDADLRGRVKGTVPGKKGPNYDAFSLRFEQKHGKAPGTFAENAYDAVYLLAYAIVAAGDPPVSGAHIAAGLRLMSQGAMVTVGPSSLNAAFSEVLANQMIDFDGASGPLDFDNDKGEAASDIDIWCIDLDSNDEAEFISSGQHYDADSGMVVGTDACP